MRTKLSILISLLYFSSVHLTVSMAQDFPSHHIKLETQDQVNSLLIQYPNCTEITGALIIGESIDNLNGLLGITHIHGGIFLANNNQLTNFAGLDSLIYIDKSSDYSYLAYYHEQIIEPGSIDSIAIYGTMSDVSIYIQDNGALQNFDGLEKLKNIDGSIWIKNNNSLKNLNGLQNIRYPMSR